MKKRQRVSCIGVAARLATVTLPALVMFPSGQAAAQAVPPPAVFPGRVQAEDFRNGGEGVGYHDTTTGNTGGAYRTTDVDIQATTDTGGGFNVGWTAAGEWLAYDVTVNQTAVYDLTLRVASGATGTKTMRIDVDGAAVATVNFTSAAGWQVWSTLAAGSVSLPSGSHLVKVNMLTGNINFNWLEATAQAPGSLGFSAASYSVAENGGNATVTVTRTGGGSGTVTAAFATSNGSATAGSDYTARSGTLTFGNGVTSQSFTVAITDDTLAEANETINVTLSAPSGGAVLRAPTTVPITIVDNDQPSFPPLPGRIQAEAFRAGGEGVGYHDTTPGNTGGQGPATDVDMQTTTDVGGGLNVGWTAAGEWLAYDVTVGQAGAFDFTARVASGSAGTKTLRFDVDGTAVATLNFTDASGWQSWISVSAHNVSLTAGNHLVRVNMITGGFNLNWWEATTTAPNVAPIAAAGPDQTAIVGRAVTLDGTASRDPDSGPQALTFQWTQTAGPAVTLAGATTAHPTFTPAAAAIGALDFRLQVSDGNLSATDTVTVTVVGDPSVLGPLGTTRQVYAAPNLDYGYLAQPPITYTGDFGVVLTAQGDYREYHLFNNATYSTRTVDMGAFDCGGTDIFPPIAADSHNVPVNGIFFRPSGNGPFPIVFFVHGSHVPVERSEPGYEEAAAHLASYGVIAVTIDENHANAACGNGGRAVLLLENIKQFRTWNGTAGHPLFGKIDMSRIMVIGHSRGGEAVGHASFFNQLTKNGVTSIRPYPNTPDFAGFNDPVSVDGSGPFGPWQFNLQAVVAVAPTDKQYNPVDPANDTQQIVTVVNDNYFMIYGSRDADVSTFDGYPAYDRAIPFVATAAADNVASVKGLFYLHNANHNYFNRIWALHQDGTGRCLSGTCYSATLQLSLADQYGAMKTWLTALAQSFVLNNPAYIEVLRQKPVLAAVLPQNAHTDSGAALPLVFNSQFQDKFRRVINHYEEDTSLLTTSPLPPGISGQNEIQAGLTASEVLMTVDGSPFYAQQTRALKAVWGATGARAYRTFFTGPLPLTTGGGQALTQLALRIGITSEETQNATGVNQDFTMFVRDAAGHTATVTGGQLFGAVPVLPYPNSITTAERTNQFGAKPQIVVMQTVRLPLSVLAGQGVATDGITEIQLKFDRTSSGSAYVDDVQLTR